MIGFFKKSKICAKKRLLECIKTDRKTIRLDVDKIREDIEFVLRKYTDIDGEVKLEITNKNNRRYITACAFVK